MITFRFATYEDVDLYFNWTNDPMVRDNSYAKETISYREHVRWFNEKINSTDCYLYLFENERASPVGQARIEHKDGTAYIGVSVAAESRGQGVGKEIIRVSTDDFLSRHPDIPVLAYIFKSNVSSYQSFCKSGFVLLKEEVYKNIPSYILIKSLRKNE